MATPTLALPGGPAAVAAPLKQQLGRDDYIMRGAVVALALWLVLTVLLPLWALLSKSFQAADGSFVGLANFQAYFANPALATSIGNSVWIAALSTVICVLLAFAYAYGLTRTCMPARGLFKTIAQIPILAPSLLPAISLVYLFGNQGLAKGLLFGASIYGPIGIVIGEVFWTFPHALIIITTALAISDARLYEAAEALRASPNRTFWTVTIPGARYGLISAVFVVFTLVITDFGVPKVIGGQFNVLATDIYKQVVGQQNFQMGAVVGLILLLPAVIAFAVDQVMQRRQSALLSARAVPYTPKPDARIDRLMLIICSLIAFAIIVMLAVAFFASIATFWPYNLTPSFKNYDFDMMDGGGWASYYNSLELAALTALFGTAIVFSGAYLVEKTPRFKQMRGFAQFLALLPLAVPGLGAGPGLHLLLQQPVQPVQFHLRHHDHPGGLHGVALLFGVAPHRGDRTQADRPGVRDGIGLAAGAVLAYLQPRHPAGVPAGRPGHRDVSVRQCHDHRIRRGLPLCPEHDPGGHRRPEHGRCR